MLQTMKYNVYNIIKLNNGVLMHDLSLLEIQIIERIYYFRLNFESYVIFSCNVRFILLCTLIKDLWVN